MNTMMRELEPRELEAVIGGALYGVTATAFRLPGRSTTDSAALKADVGMVDPTAPRRAS